LGQVDKAPAAPKQAEAGPEEHGKSRDLQFDAHDKHDAAVSLAGNIIGKKVDATDIASIAGAPDGSRVRLEHVDEDTMSIHIEGDGFVAKRSIVRGSDGKPYLYNDSLMVEKSHQGQGIGTKVFGRQVEQATQHGISHIQTFAERKDTTDPAKQQVGYKVWPKMGYDAPIPNYILKRAGRPEGQEFHNVSDLMKTPEGRDWWDERGDGMEMKFDLTPGSQSQQVWAAYRAKKAK
jgi:GNAT superfamily N-acetyltransferase